MSYSRSTWETETREHETPCRGQGWGRPEDVPGYAGATASRKPAAAAPGRLGPSQCQALSPWAECCLVTLSSVTGTPRNEGCFSHGSPCERRGLQNSCAHPVKTLERLQLCPRKIGASILKPPLGRLQIPQICGDVHAATRDQRPIRSCAGKSNVWGSDSAAHTPWSLQGQIKCPVTACFGDLPSPVQSHQLTGSRPQAPGTTTHQPWSLMSSWRV